MNQIIANRKTSGRVPPRAKAGLFPMSIAIVTIIIRTYAEEENCEAIFRQSGSEFIILRIPMTENGTIPNEKLHILVVENLVENLKISFRD
jgi:hypothetical protein